MDIKENGHWKVYKKGSEPKELYDDIHWARLRDGYYPYLPYDLSNLDCIERCLKSNDIYVYYDFDTNLNDYYPEIVFSVSPEKNCNVLKFVSGFKIYCNIKPELLKILKNKLICVGVGDNDEVFTRIEKLEKLGEIYEKYASSIELTRDDLIFLYEIEDTIGSFGTMPDLRISEIKNKRNAHEDYKTIFDGSIKKINKDLYLPVKSLEGITLPLEIMGSLHMNEIEVLENFTFPKLHGWLYADKLKYAKNVVIPYVGCDLKCYYSGSLISFNNLEVASNLVFPRTVNNLYLGSLKKIDSVQLPDFVYDCLNLSSVEIIENYVFPKYVNCMNLKSVKKMKNVTFGTVGWHMFLDSLEYVENVTLPKRYGEDTFRSSPSLAFPNLKTVINLAMPSSYGKEAWISFDSLEYANSLLFYDELSGVKRIGFYALKCLEGVQLPKKMQGSIVFGELNYSDNMMLPDVGDGKIEFADGVYGNHNVQQTGGQKVKKLSFVSKNN